MYYRERNVPLDKKHITRRKSILKAVQRLYPGETFVWVGGVLHFVERMWPVKGAPEVPKPGKEAKGAAANEQPKPRTSLHRRRQQTQPAVEPRSRHLLFWS